MIFPDIFDPEDLTVESDPEKYDYKTARKNARKEIASDLHEEWAQTYNNTPAKKHLDIISMDELENIKIYKDIYPFLAFRKLIMIYCIKISLLCFKVILLRFLYLYSLLIYFIDNKTTFF